MMSDDIKNQDVVTDQPQQTAAEHDFKTLYLRAQADLQNYTKRMQRERAEWTEVVKAETVTKFLPIIEDIERAFATAQASAQGETIPWLQGLELVVKNAQKTLANMGIEEIKTDGQFDPMIHEALMNVASEQHQPGDIVQVLSKGYTLHGKVVKHARVSVAQ